MERFRGLPLVLSSDGTASITDRSLRDMALPSGMEWQRILPELDMPQRLDGKRTLDVGAGVSDLSERFREMGAEAHAIDPRFDDIPGLIRTIQFQLASG